MSNSIEQCPDCGSEHIKLHRRQVAMVTPETGRTYKRVFICEMCGYRFYGTGEECEGSPRATISSGQSSHRRTF